MIHFVLPITPSPKGRPKAVAFAGHARVYTPAKTARYEAQVAELAASHLGGRLLSGPLVMHLHFVLPRPKSLDRRKDPEGLIPCDRRPDLDNLVKSVVDGLKAAWGDDAQVYSLRAEKYYAEKGRAPRIEVTIWQEETDVPA
jgi:Holliday junction resolvase RusA-like endonuclease